MTLKELRNCNSITQLEASKIVGMPLRTYSNYENDSNKINTLKYKMIYDILKEKFKIDEEHGVLTLEQIKGACKTVLNEYSVKYCILFGSYAKGCANEKSDVDLLISTDVKGLRFFGIVEALRNELHKKVDLLDLKQLTDNSELLDEILKDADEMQHYFRNPMEDYFFQKDRVQKLLGELGIEV